MLNDKPFKWTAWDRLEMNIGDITLTALLNYFDTTFGAEISMLSYGVTILYAMYSQKSRSKERMSMKISELVKMITKTELLPNQKYLILEVCATDLDGEDLELPYIRYCFRP
jgi:ubiquitin-activating enzyme E1